MHVRPEPRRGGRSQPSLGSNLYAYERPAEKTTAKAVDSYHPQHRRRYEPRKVMVVYPDNGNGQVAHHIANGRGPDGQGRLGCS